MNRIVKESLFQRKITVANYEMAWSENLIISSGYQYLS